MGPRSHRGRVDAPAPDARPLWRRIAPQVAVIAVIALVGAVGAWYFNAGRSGSGEITKSGDLPASELQVGDCFDLKDPTAEDVDDVSAEVRSEEHEFEVYLVGFLPAGDYPGDAAFSTFVEDECLPAFDAYGGDRSIQCAVYHPLMSRLTGSLKGPER